MSSRTAGVALAVLLGVGSAVCAQTATPPGERSSAAAPAREITVTGCLVRTPDGHFALMGAQAEPMARNTPTGTSGTSAAGSTEPAGSGPTRPAAGAIVWRLSGGGADLEKHVGHRLQVTGKTPSEASDPPEPPSSTTAPTTSPDPATPGDTKGQELEVQSIKLVAGSCS